MSSKAAAALTTNPTTPVSGNAAAAPAAPAAPKTRTVRSFDDLRAAALQLPGIDSKQFDELVKLHAMGGSLAIAALAGMRDLVKAAESTADDTDHAAAFTAVCVNEIPHSDRIKAINAAIAEMHASMGIYNAEHSANMRIVFTDATLTAAPFVGVTNRKRATPTRDTEFTWLKLLTALWGAGHREIAIPVSGIDGMREHVKLVDPATIGADDNDSAILTDGDKRYTPNEARAIVRTINGESRAINRNQTHNCRRQFYTLDGRTLDTAYDEITAALAAQQA